MLPPNARALSPCLTVQTQRSPLLPHTRTARDGSTEPASCGVTTPPHTKTRMREAAGLLSSDKRQQRSGSGVRISCKKWGIGGVKHTPFESPLGAALEKEVVTARVQPRVI